MRVSTEEQKKSGLGIQAQLQTCLDYLTKKGQADYVVYKDEAVSSGLRMEERDQLNEALDALQKGDTLLVANHDRLSRDVMEAAILQYEIEKKGCMLISVMEDYSGMDPGVAALMTTLIRGFAQYERYRIRQRTKKALAAKRAKGERVGHVPYGFKVVNKQLLIDDYEAEALRIMYNMRKRKRMSLRDIASEMNSRGIKPRTSDLWTHAAIGRVYNNYPKVTKMECLQ